MAWVRFDDGWLENPKIRRATVFERALWQAAITYANRHLTDGVVESEDLPWIGTLATVDNPEEAAERLVTLGLFERHERGYLIHDYADFQPLRAEVEAARAKKQQAGRKGGLAKAGDRLAGASHAAKQLPSSDVAELYPDPVPDPVPRDIAYLSPEDADASRERGSSNRDRVRSITPECVESLRVGYPSVDLNHELKKYRGHKFSNGYADEGVGFEEWLRRGAEKRLHDATAVPNQAGVTRIDDPDYAPNRFAAAKAAREARAATADDDNYTFSERADREVALSNR